MTSRLDQRTVDRAAGGAAGFSLLYILFAAFIVPEVLSVHIGDLRLPPIRFVAILMAAPAAIIFLRRNGLALYSFDWLFVGFAVWTVICLMRNYGVATGYQVYGVFLIEYVVVYFAIQGMLRSTAQMRAAIEIMILVVAALGCVAVVETIVRKPIVLDMAYKILGRGGYEVAPGTPNAFRFGLMRAFSVFNHPILHGLFCAAFFSYAWYLARGTTSRLLRAGVVAMAAMTSLSAGPMVALLVQGGLIGLEMVSRGLKQRALLIGGAIAAFLIFVHFAAESGVYRLVQLITFDGGSGNFRLIIWQNSIDDVLRNPLFGLRPEDFTRPHWMPPSIDHHWVVQAMLGGVPSVVLIGATLTVMTRFMFRKPDDQVSPDVAALRRAWAYSMLGMVMCGFTVFFFDSIAPLFAAMIGFGGAICRFSDEETAAPASATPATPRRRRMVIGDMAADAAHPAAGSAAMRAQADAPARRRTVL